MLDPAGPEYAVAHNLWAKGKGHIFGALAVEQVARSYAADHGIEDVEQYIFSGNYSASLHLLLGFAAELLTKSALILNGGGPELARKLGHDLVALLDAAEEHGFEPPDRHTREIFEYLREPHLNHQFRYGDAGEVAMPDLVHTIPAFQAISNIVQDALEAAD